jgi:hypothetical protein
MDLYWCAMAIGLQWNPENLLLVGKDKTGAVPSIAQFFPKVRYAGKNAYGWGERDAEGNLVNDGDAILVIFGNFRGTAAADAALATPEGTLVTSFRFIALSPGETVVEIATPDEADDRTYLTTESFGQGIPNYFNLGEVRACTVPVDFDFNPNPEGPSQETVTLNDFVTRVVNFGETVELSNPSAFTELIGQLNAMAADIVNT